MSMKRTFLLCIKIKELNVFNVLIWFVSFRLENEKLKQQLKKKDEEVIQTRATLERFANAVSSFSINFFSPISIRFIVSNNTLMVINTKNAISLYQKLSIKLGLFKGFF